MAITDAKVEDERGRTVPAVREIASAPRWPWQVPSYRLLSPDIRRWMVYEGFGGLGVMALAVVVAFLVAVAQHQAATVVAIFGMVALIGSWFAMNQILNWKWTGAGRRFAARVLAANGMCPSCGYGIEGVRADADGLTTCPECATGWRVGVLAACGCCQYSLMGASPESDGSLRCPECGWRWDPYEPD